jgi:hypothetical protein
MPRGYARWGTAAIRAVGVPVVAAALMSAGGGMLMTPGAVAAASRTMSIADRVGDVTRPSNSGQTPAAYRNLPDAKRLLVQVKRGRVLVTFAMVEVIANDRKHVQMVSTVSYVQKKKVQVYAISNRAPVLAVNGRRVCASKVRQRFDARAETISVSYPVACLPAGRVMYGFQGDSQAYYMNATSGGGGSSSGMVGRDAVQETMPKDVAIR